MVTIYSHLISMLGGANIATMILWSVMLLSKGDFSGRLLDSKKSVHAQRWWMLLLSVTILLIYMYYMVVEVVGLYETQRAMHLSHTLDMIVVPMCAVLVSYLTHAFTIDRRFVVVNFLPYILLIIANQFFVTSRMLDIAFFYTAVYYLLGVFTFLVSGVRYEKQLTDLYASTDGHSLFWMWGVLILSILQGIAWWLYIYFFSPVMVVVYYAFSLLNWNYIFFHLYRSLLLAEASMTPEPEVQPMLDAILTPETESDDDQKRKAEFLSQLDKVCVQDELYKNEELTRDLLARTMCISHTRLTSMLRETTGKSFYEYINSVRLEKATSLLRSTDMAIEQVGFEVGYRHRSSFYRAFSAEFGCTPNEWRSEHRTE